MLGAPDRARLIWRWNMRFDLAARDLALRGAVVIRSRRSAAFLVRVCASDTW
nr:MAG TPA: hypothetical protein [Bacteriophage sp.]